MFMVASSFYFMDKEYDRLGTKYLSHLTDDELMNFGALGLANLFH